jgi:TetR/AcrR family transcriptional repressor of multidrug resistance operon
MENITDKKRAIFKSTLELVKDNGFHGTPMSLIAKKAGVAAGTIYVYFESKDALMIELFSYIRAKMIEAILVDDNEDADFKERFFSIWLNHCFFYINNPDMVYFLEQYTNSPYYHRDDKKDADKFQKVLEAFVKTGIENGFLKEIDHHLLGLFVHGSVISAAKIYLKKLKIGKDELRQVAQIVWDGIKK